MVILGTSRGTGDPLPRSGKGRRYIAIESTTTFIWVEFCNVLPVYGACPGHPYL